MAKFYALDNCAGKIIEKSEDIEKLYSKSLFMIMETLLSCHYDGDEIQETIEDFKKECAELLKGERTFASCLDICEICEVRS